MAWAKRGSDSTSVSVRRLAFPSVAATWDVVRADSLCPGDAILLYAGEPQPVPGVIVAVEGIELVFRVETPGTGSSPRRR